MARPLRVEFAGAVYPVMARGHHGQKLCANDTGRERWVVTWVRAWQRPGGRLHAWARMGNHYQLLLETPAPNRVAGMKWFPGTDTHAVRMDSNARDSVNTFGAIRGTSLNLELIVRVVEKQKGAPWPKFCEGRGDWGRELALYLGWRQGRIQMGAAGPTGRGNG